MSLKERLTKLLPQETGSTGGLQPESPADHYAKSGHIILRGALDKSAVGAVNQAIDETVVGSSESFLRHPNAQREPNRFDICSGTGDQIIGNQILSPHTDGATPELADAVCKMICTKKLASLLRETVCEEPPFDFRQTILFFQSPGTDPHIDGWFFDTKPLGKAFTVWIPLEQVDYANGGVGIYPWAADDVQYGLLKSALKAGSEGAYGRFHDLLDEEISKRQLVAQVPRLFPGDCVVFASATPHFSVAPKQNCLSRRGMQVLIKPSRFEETTYFGDGEITQRQIVKYNDCWNYCH